MSATMSGAPHASRLPGLDGLRAIAVLSVILYHLDVSGVFNAGFLGVDIFFVISGFIITCLLAREFGATGRLALGAFYWRRAKRLFPAAIGLVVVLSALTPWLAPDAMSRLQSDLPAAFVYASNWWQISSNQSYFEHFGRPPLLQHLWSLAIEEQYYIFWPLAVAGILKLGGRRALFYAALIGAGLSTFWMGWLHWGLSDGDPSRMYLGTDTHLMGLLTGSALACCWNPWLKEQDDVGRWFRRWVSMPGPWVTAVALIWMMWTLNEQSAGLFRGGFWLASVLTAAWIVASTSGQGLWLSCLSHPWVQWMGSRSYSLYLWHWPLLVWWPVPAQEGPAVAWRVVFVLLMTGAAAEVSWRILEQGQWRIQCQKQRRRLGAAVVTAAVALVVALGMPAPAPQLNAAERYVLQAAVWVPDEDALSEPELGIWDEPIFQWAAYRPGQGPRKPSADRQGRKQTALKPKSSSNPTRTAHARSDSVGRSKSRPSQAEVSEALVKGRSVTVIGDSVMLGAQPVLARAFETLYLDAKVGRQGSDGMAVAQQVRMKKQLGQVVVIHLGTNGYLNEKQLRALLDYLSDRDRILLVNNFGNRRWVDVNNELLSRVSHEYANVALIDWHRTASDNPKLVVSDGIHPSMAGLRAMTRLLVDRIEHQAGNAAAGWSPKPQA